jgi:CubicO group peptidase (beta-lactamase class C family)
MLRRVLMSMVMLCLAVSVAQAQDQALDFAPLEAAISEALTAQNTPGLSVAVVYQGRVIYSGGFGVRNLETRDPVTADTLFQIGSVTKPLTAIGVLRLVQRGQVDLDAPVSQYLPEFTVSDNITVRHLLSHLGGLNDQAIPFGPTDPDALRASMATFDARAQFADVGLVQSYSNPGFNIVGAVIEAVSGQSYADYMAQRVFEPMGMARTTFHANRAITYPVAVGHVPTLFGVAPQRPTSDNAAEYPSGFAYSSALDLTHLIEFILNDGQTNGRAVLTTDLARAMQQPVAGGLSGGWYGLGLTVGTYRGTVDIGHNGQIEGYAALLQTLPEVDFGVVVLANNSAFDAAPIFDTAVEVVLDLPEPAQPTAEAIADLPPLADYVGDYDIRTVDGAAFVSINITAEQRDNGGYLIARALGQPLIRLNPVGVDLFEMVVAEQVIGQVGFIRDETDAVRFISLGGRTGVLRG